MRLEIHVHHHAPPVDTRVVDKLDLISAQLEVLMDSLERIEAAVARQTTLENSSLALITDLKHQVAEALGNTKLPADVEARLAAIFPVLEANNDRVAAALTANTDAAPSTDTPTPAPTTDVSGAGNAPTEPAPPSDGTAPSAT